MRKWLKKIRLFFRKYQSIYGGAGRPTGWSVGQDAKQDQQEDVAKMLEQAIHEGDREFASIEVALQG